MVRWLNKKDRAELQFEYHKGTIEARRAIIQKWFGWSVTYENFCKDRLRDIIQEVSQENNEADEQKREEKVELRYRNTPPEEYFWDAICKSIFFDNSYEGRIAGRDSDGNVVAVEDPKGISPMSHYRYPLWWMSGHCRWIEQGSSVGSQAANERRYDVSKDIPLNNKIRLYKTFLLIQRFWRVIIVPLGIAYFFILIHDIILALVS